MSYLPGLSELQPLHAAPKLWIFALISIIFALLGRIVRGVTAGGAIAGAVVCFALMGAAGGGAFVTLFTVFLLTWISTRIGYARKQQIGTAEPGNGRNALQVLANLGIAAACAVTFSVLFPDRRLFLAIAAALSEAAADTVSSELGQALGGMPRLITTWHKIESGTDGAVSVTGTLCGAAAAVVVATIFVWTERLSGTLAVLCAFAGIMGMLFDSVLGATLERRSVLNNNGVNFLSTGFAAAVVLLILR